MRKKINLWKCSIGLFVVVGLYAFWFVYKKTLASMLILLVITACASVFYVYCNRRITLPEGYTVVQARRFYRACMAEGLNSRRKLTEDEAVLQRIVGQHECAAGMDEEALWKLYCDGRAADSLKM